MRRVVLDASAVMALFNRGPGGDKVEKLIQEAMLEKERLLMSVVNWGEIYYATWRDRGKELAERVLAEIARLPIEIEAADFEATKLAAKFKAQYALPYADCFAASLARRHNAPVLTSDSDFLRVKSEITIQLI